MDQAVQNKQKTNSSFSVVSAVSVKSNNQFDTASLIKSLGITKSSIKRDVISKISDRIIDDILEDGLSAKGVKYGMSISKLENGQYAINGNKFSSLEDFRLKLFKDANFKVILKGLIKDMFDRIQNHLDIEFNQTVIDSHKSRISEIDIDKKGIEKNIAKLNESIQASNDKYTSLLSNMYSIKRQHESDMMAVSKNIADTNTAYSQFVQSKIGQESQTNTAIGNLIKGQSNVLASLAGLQQNTVQQQNAALDSVMRAQQSYDDRRQRVEEALSKQEADYYANLAKMNADYSNTKQLTNVIGSGLKSIQSAVIAGANASIAAVQAASDVNVAGFNALGAVTKAASDANIAGLRDIDLSIKQLGGQINGITDAINIGFDDLRQDLNKGLDSIKDANDKIFEKFPPAPGVPLGCDPNVLKGGSGTLMASERMYCQDPSWKTTFFMVNKKNNHPKYNQSSTGPFKMYICNGGGHWCCSDGEYGVYSPYSSNNSFYTIV